MAAIPLPLVACGRVEVPPTPTPEARSAEATLVPSVAPLASPLAVLTPAETLVALRRSVVRVFAYRSSALGVVGTGVVLGTEGHILTSYEVVDGADAVFVTLGTGERVSAEVVGLDRVTALAVVRVDGDRLTPAALGDSSAVDVGQPVVAIGYEITGSEPVLGQGVVTLMAGTYVMDPLTTVAALIESDASLPMGGMGGPMVNDRGEVIGIHIGHALDPIGGMAVGINDAREVAAQLMDRGYVMRSSLGVVPLDVNESMARVLGLYKSTGIMVADVSPGMAAELAGLHDYDVIVRLGDAAIANSWDLGLFLMRHPPGATVVVTYYRGEERLSTGLVLGERVQQTR